MNHFRSYQSLELTGLGDKHIVLCGANGAGKTNILEALSLLSPGKGLRQARISELQQTNSPDHTPWSILAKIGTLYGPVRIGTGREINTDKRLIRINGEAAKNQGSLAEWLSCLWLTPQMDRLFLDDKASRRKFFDRLVFTFDPAHMGRLTRYENAMRQRLKLLKDGQHEPVWLSALESQMAETGIALCAARHIFCDKLQNAYHNATQEEKDHFPGARLGLDGEVEEMLKHSSALEAEEKLRKVLEKNRKSDSESGTTACGPHRSDFFVFYADKHRSAASSSTGEQKALLIGIILAHARLLKEEQGQAPLLLLDEIVAHLDPGRRRVLASLLGHYGSQIWMTGTDPTLFEEFKPHSSFFTVSESSETGASSVILSNA